MTRPSDNILMKMLKEDNQQVFDYLFQHYYNYMCQVVYGIIPDYKRAEDLVQNVFIDIWKNRSKLEVKSSIKGYLRKASVHKALSYIKSQRLNFHSSGKVVAIHPEPLNIKNNEEINLETSIDFAIDELPEKYRIVFAMSRFEHMDNCEIGRKLGISKHTVESLISNALQHLTKTLNPNGQYLQ